MAENWKQRLTREVISAVAPGTKVGSICEHDGCLTVHLGNDSSLVILFEPSKYALRPTEFGAYFQAARFHSTDGVMIKERNESGDHVLAEYEGAAVMIRRLGPPPQLDMSSLARLLVRTAYEGSFSSEAVRAWTDRTFRIFGVAGAASGRSLKAAA